MRRRDLLLLGVIETFSLFTTSLRLFAEEALRWSPAVNGLTIGLRLQSDLPHSLLLVFLKNVGATPRDLFVSMGRLQRIEFTATAPDRREYAINDRELYRPCGGVCDLPLSERMNPGTTRKWTFALEDLLYVPPKGPYTNLGILLQGGYSVRASFEVTEQQLKDNKLSLEDPWLGHIASGETR